MNQPASVLIVDDDGTCETIAGALRLKGYTVHVAKHRRAALDVVAGQGIELAIVDIKFPEMSGLDLLQAIKGVSPNIEVIVVTASAPLPTTIRTIKGAAFAYVVKPFEMEHLIATLNKAHEKQRLAEALRQSEERYRLVTEHIHDAVFLLDLENRFTFGNGRVEELTGYRLHELEGRPISVVLTPEGTRAAAARSDTLRAGHDVPLFYETELIRKDRTKISVEVNSTSVVRGGEIIARLAVARDITQRKQAEAAVRESEERFRATFEQAAVGIAHADIAGRWLRMNQQLCEILGYTQEELRTLTFQEITHPDDLDTDLTAHRRLLANEIQSYATEKRFVKKGGSIVWVHLTVSFARDAAGEPQYWIAVIQDISERKRLEQELLHAQKLEGVGQLAGGIAHDFNNVLTVIIGRSYLILRRLRPADPLYRHFEVIQKTADRAAGLTQQLLAFSRKQVLQPKVVDLNMLVGQSATMLTRLIGEDIELTFVPGEDLGRVRVDPGQLEQVIVNLAVNARDAMPQGGRLTIETGNVALDETYAARHVGVVPGAHVMLAVSDTGTGMDAATKARMFEPFFTTKGPGEGTGLGLATAYGIIAQSGGHVRVYSEVGSGTSFKMYLPRVSGPADTLEAAAPIAMPSGVETILLIEDEEEVRKLAREVLEQCGYTVLEASVGSDAMLMAQRHAGTIELLLTDVVMPRMSGRALAEHITAVRPEIRVLFMSGYTDAAIVRHGVLEPEIDFIQKPFTPTALALKVRRVLDVPL